MDSSQKQKSEPKAADTNTVPKGDDRKQCPECLADIPKAAKKCSHCGSKQPEQMTVGTLIVAGILLIIIFFTFSSMFGGDDSNSNENTNTNVNSTESSNTNTEQTSSNVSAGMQRYALAVQTEVLPSLERSNDHILSAGEYGSNMEISAAQSEIALAQTYAAEARTSLRAQTPPAEANELHRLMQQALEKYRQALNMYETGMATLDADMITRGSEVYAEGTAYITEATAELNRLQGN